MNITEVFDQETTEEEYVDPSSDKEIPQLHDLRKTKLTLADINRLRLIKDVRDFEKKANLGNIKKQYRAAAGTEMGI